MDNDNTIFIGNKEVTTYVYSVLMQANKGISEIFLKARGRAISKAVDVSQIVINKNLQDWKVDGVNIGTEEKDYDEDQIRETPMLKGKKFRMSTIEIKLIKK